MRKKDYFVLAKEKNKYQKRQSRNTIIGIIISLCISIVCLFTLISFEYGIKSSANSEKDVATVELNYSDTTNCAINHSKKEYISKNNLIEDIVDYKVYSVNFYTITRSLRDQSYIYPVISLDNEVMERDNKYIIGDSILSYEDTSTIILDSEYSYLKKNNEEALLAGSLFSDDNQEIMVSDLFVKQLGFSDYNEIIGKRISYQYKLAAPGYSNRVQTEYEYELEELLLFQNYKIVGVFNTNIYNCPSRWSSFFFSNYVDSLWCPMFWVKDSSIKSAGCTVEYSHQVYYYEYTANPVETFKTIAEDGYIALPFGFNTLGFNDIREDSKQIIQCKNVQDVYKFINEVDKYLDYNTGNAYYFYYSLDAYFTFYPFFFYSVIIFAFFSIFLSILSFLNIYRIMEYSISSNMYLFAMERAMGATIKDIKGVYFAELLINYLKSVIISIGISGVLCLIFTLVINRYLRIDDFVDGCIKYSISFGYYPLIMILVILSFGIIIYFLASLLCNKIKKGALVNKLNGE